MRAKPRGSGRGSSRRIPSTIRKGSTPPPPRISSRIRSSPPRRRSRSPRPPRKSTLPRSPIKRRLSLSPKRSVGRKNRDDVRLPPKRPRDIPKDRRPTPGKKYLEKPSYEDPRKEITYNKELKNITINVQRDFLGESKRVERTVVHPEDVAIVRRPVEDHRGRGYVGMENGRYPRPAPMPPRPHRHMTGRGRDGQGEGSTPIFNRQEIIENKRKYDEDLVIPSHSDRLHNEPSTSYSDNFRIIRDNLDKERDRIVNNSRRSPRDYDYKPRDFRSREDLRYQPTSTSGLRSRSFDRSRDYLPERKERYDDRDVHRGPRRSLERDRGPRRSLERDRGPRRSLERDRGRSDDRLMRRHPSPESRRHVDQFRDYEDRRTRSLERRDMDTSHFRDHHDYPPGDRFSGIDHSNKSRTYYEVGGREHPSPSPRGRGAGGPYSRGRGGGFPGRPFIRNPGFAVRPIPADRAIRGLPVARVPIIARRLPFPPRKSSRGSLQPRR